MQGPPGSIPRAAAGRAFSNQGTAGPQGTDPREAWVLPELRPSQRELCGDLSPGPEHDLEMPRQGPRTPLHTGLSRRPSLGPAPAPQCEPWKTASEAQPKQVRDAPGNARRRGVSRPPSAATAATAATGTLFAETHA